MTSTSTRRGWFAGRLGRMEFFTGYLLLFVLTFVSAITLFIAIAVSVSLSILTDLSAFWVLVFLILGVAAAITSFIFYLSLAIRRLHDFDASGLWILAVILLGLIPFVPLVFLLLLLVIPGSHGSNRFGPASPNFSLARIFTG